MVRLIMAAMCALLPAHTFAQSSCAQGGEPPAKIPSSLAPKIIKWVEPVELKLGIAPANWSGLSSDAAPGKKDALLQMQALAARWQREVPENSGESIFRQAVAHGINVQYEKFMASEDPQRAADHRYWMNVEAWRASECLKLINHP
jgi:hypothetical protein